MGAMTGGRKFGLGLAAFLAALGILYVWWWHALAARSQALVENWVQARREAGAVAQTGALSVSGFPFAVVLTMAEPALADAPGRFGWQGPPLEARIRPLAPHRIHLNAPGRHRILKDGESFAIEAGSAGADIVLSRQDWRQVRLSLEDAAIGSARLAGLEVEATRPAADGDESRPSLTLQVTLAGLVLPDGPGMAMMEGPLGGALAARVKGPLRPEGGAPAFAAWRDAGGTVELDRLDLSWPPLAARGQATLALDGALQPLLAGTLTLSGLPGAVERAAAAGLLRPGEAAAAGIVLGMLGRPGPGGALEWTLPVTVQERDLSLGPIRLGRLARLPW